MLNYELISEWGNTYRNDNTAIKIYSADTPYDYVAETARIQSLLCNIGLPVPAVYGVKKAEEGKTALEMAYIERVPFIYDEMSMEERKKALEGILKQWRKI